MKIEYFYKDHNIVRKRPDHFKDFSLATYDQETHRCSLASQQHERNKLAFYGELKRKSSCSPIRGEPDPSLYKELYEKYRDAYERVVRQHQQEIVQFRALLQYIEENKATKESDTQRTNRRREEREILMQLHKLQSKIDKVLLADEQLKYLNEKPQ